jgi:hypothetical protein
MSSFLALGLFCSSDKYWFLQFQSRTVLSFYGSFLLYPSALNGLHSRCLLLLCAWKFTHPSNAIWWTVQWNCLTFKISRTGSQALPLGLKIKDLPHDDSRLHKGKSTQNDVQIKHSLGNGQS